VGKLGEEFDRVFDRLLVPRFLTEPLVRPFPFETTGAEWIPVMDMVETPTEYVVRLEVPGFHKENLDINLTGNVLRIMGHKESVQEGTDERYLYREREVGRFVRTLRLPVAAEAKPRSIPNHAMQPAVPTAYSESAISTEAPTANPASKRNLPDMMAIGIAGRPPPLPKSSTSPCGLRTAAASTASSMCASRFSRASGPIRFTLAVH
jgi:HSP20 family protein